MAQENPEVNSDDYLGRSISSQKRAKRAKRDGQLQPSSFRPRCGEIEISVDRLNRSPTGECEYDEEHVKIAESRDGTFYGWGYLTRSDVETQTPCVVEPNAVPSNPNHVLIKFPENVKRCKEERNSIASELAVLSNWLQHRDPTIS